MRHGETKHLPKVTRMLKAEKGFELRSPNPLTIYWPTSQFRKHSWKGHHDPGLVFNSLRLTRRPTHLFKKTLLSTHKVPGTAMALRDITEDKTVSPFIEATVLVGEGRQQTYRWGNKCMSDVVNAEREAKQGNGDREYGSEGLPYVVWWPGYRQRTWRSRAGSGKSECKGPEAGVWWYSQGTAEGLLWWEWHGKGEYIEDEVR